METNFSGPGQIPPDLQSKLGIQGNSQFPFDPERIKRKVRLTLITTVAFVVIILGLMVSLIFFPYLFSGIFEIFDRGPIKGEMLDLAYFPSESAGGRAWIVTNPSFNYIQTVSTPGSYSVSSECVGCKIRVYIFDPLTQTVQTQWDIPITGRPLDVNLDRQQDSVWMSARQTDDFDPIIYKYDAKTGAELFNTNSFIKNFPQLTAPIVELMQLENPLRYNLKLADGKEFVFDPGEGKLYADQQEFDKSLNGEKEATVFALVKESSDQRKKLFSITGPGNKVLNGKCDAHANDSDTLKFFCAATAKQLSEEIFLEPIIIYQDERLAVIFHQDNLGRSAQRQLTAFGLDGKKLWTVPQDRLFNEIRYSTEDPFSGIFFIKDHLSAEKAGDVFVFSVEGVGAVGINTENGAELWRIRP